MSLEQKQKILAALAGGAERVFELQSRLTSLRGLGPSNGGTGEQDKADYLESWLRSFGIDDIEHVDAPDSRVPSGKRPNLIVRVPGRTEKTLWILGHMDVVPAGEESLWNTDPWTVTRDPADPDLIYGRGVEDNQQAIVCGCMVAAALKEQGITPDLSLGLIFVSDEETGNAYGIQHLLKEKNFVKEGDLVIVPDSGSEDGGFIEVAEKGILWLKVTVQGQQCHASKPDDGKNALVAAAAIILGTSDIEKAFDARNDLFSPSRSTFTPSKHEANVPNVNTMPGREVFYIDCRVLPCYSLDEVLSAFRKLGSRVAAEYGVTVDVDIQMCEPAAAPTPEDSAVVLSLKKAVKEVLGVECRCGGVGGSTVAVSFRERGIPAAVWAHIFENCHTPNEAARLSFAVGDAQVYASMLFID
ncbi:MAG: M20 family metallo-hydrolase [Mailhella sp.]|nr:M20 family metallo-hydrolase [Mailhella sp.]MBQ9104597.1 M20 family metallo-hydrolase [Mailhella sp.]